MRRGCQNYVQLAGVIVGHFRFTMLALLSFASSNRRVSLPTNAAVSISGDHNCGRIIKPLADHANGVVRVVLNT